MCPILTHIVCVERPLYVRQYASAVLQQALEWDTRFLAERDVMDYSLLLGVQADGALVCGIIDYLRNYRWRESFESYVKSTPFLTETGTLYSSTRA